MQFGQTDPQGNNCSTVHCAELECGSVQLPRHCSSAELASQTPRALGEVCMNKMGGGGEDARLFYFFAQSGDAAAHLLQMV